MTKDNRRGRSRRCIVKGGVGGRGIKERIKDGRVRIALSTEKTPLKGDYSHGPERGVSTRNNNKKEGKEDPPGKKKPATRKKVKKKEKGCSQL